MEPTQELIDQLRREEFQRARDMPPEEKLIAGAVLFERACRLMMDGIRDEFPDATDEEVRRILKQRVELSSTLEARAG